MNLPYTLTQMILALSRGLKKLRSIPFSKKEKMLECKNLFTQRNIFRNNNIFLLKIFNNSKNFASFGVDPNPLPPLLLVINFIKFSAKNGNYICD